MSEAAANDVESGERTAQLSIDICMHKLTRLVLVEKCKSKTLEDL
jgi:hypothetical protein